MGGAPRPGRRGWLAAVAGSCPGAHSAQVAAVGCRVRASAPGPAAPHQHPPRPAGPGRPDSGDVLQQITANADQSLEEAQARCCAGWPSGQAAGGVEQRRGQGDGVEYLSREGRFEGIGA